MIVSAQSTTIEGFYIEAEINGQKVSYVQRNLENVSPSNEYFPGYHVTHLDASEENDRQGIGIGIFDLKLEKIKTPFKIPRNGRSYFNVSTGTSGYDIKDGNCGGVDNGCSFAGSSKDGRIQAVITKLDYTKRIIEGTFSGRLILVRTGIVRGNYPKIFLTVRNGKFKINFRIAKN